MRRRLFAVASAVSLLVWFATVGCWVLSYHMKPGTVSSLTPDGYMLGRGVRFLPDGGEISLYNQPLPYHGSTISFSPNWPKTIGFTGGGIYFRHMTWPGEFPGGTYWTLTFPILYPFVLTMLLPLIWAALLLKRRMLRKQHRCTVCRYSLTGNTSGICPECGTPVAENMGVKM